MTFENYNDFRTAALKTYTHRVPAWDRDAQFSEGCPPAPTVTPKEAGQRLSELVRQFQLEHDGTHFSFEEALLQVRQTEQGARLFALWGGRTAPPQVRSFGMQNRRQENAVASKESASREIDIRARRFMAGGGTQSYAQAVGKVLADDPDLRRQYEGA